ncbi:LysM peptidoglycan-binding domain-containing protein [Anaerocolumna sp. AGMB13020]|uniref:cell wall hydrolase n=1 Tax=Anaerocolumna sp. AGMB13020 TaxID=3081750 RepID=UPI002954DE63|nr:LysM peptidoglycan-binding domain-containing protein [Anaerocolumna sp. AGMB13020]WOO35500.1 LysM peptidoglycan-binding domain-containing protein [Anaerocolumna sp. AGMB13020]
MIKLKSVRVVLAASLLSLVLCQANVSAATYKVAANDSLYKISKLFKTTVATIKKTNNLKSDTIQKGQKLTISAKIYTVKKGDTLNKIAKANKISLANLRKANNKYNDTLKVGQKLILPGIKTTAKTTATARTATTATTSAKVEAASSKAVIKYTQKEKDLLARLITAEATGQPYKAMVAIGGVVVNRVQSKEWPDTITAVINDVPGGYYQFTPVKNGYIKKPASDIAIKAAGEALLGTDPSKGAMFYFDDSSTNEWLWAKPQTAKFGNMVFVK